MPERCLIQVDGDSMEAVVGESLAVTLLRAGRFRFRQSCTDQPRAPLCAMGTCYECQVHVNGVWARACLEAVREGMEINTHG
jgi:D-hydroxyproline dehydrogenase subunit gamma